VTRDASNGSAGGVRVTHIVFDLQGGGMETLVAALAARFAGTRVTMSVISLSGRAGRVGEAIRGDLDGLYAVRSIPGLSMLRPTRVARLVRETRAEVVHLHSGAWLKGALAARLAGVRRVIYTEHGREHHDPLTLQWLDRRAAARTDVVVAVSDRLRNYMHAVLGVPEERLETVANGVDISRFKPGPPSPELLRRFEIPESARVVGSVGRLEEVKGYDRLLEVFAGLPRDGEAGPLFLVICGEGALRPDLEAQAERLGIRDRVRFPGWLDDTTEFYRLLNVFTLTSHSEGVSVSLLEAMSSGAVPVVTDVGANAQVLGPELSSAIVGPWDRGTFTATVRGVLEAPERRRELADLARRRVVEHYNLDRMIERYEDLYFDCAGKRATPPEQSGPRTADPHQV
jgi:glycosyltransferase involved in cell wall biosynthesis